MSRVHYVIRFLISMAALFLLLSAQSGLASVARAQAPQDPPITIRESQAQPDFPNQITFDLQAESSAGPISSVQLLYGASQSEALTIVDATFSPGQRVRASHMLDTQVFYIPPGVEITYQWLIQDTEGNELETEPQTFVYHDERYPWQERTTRNVTIYWYEGDETFGDALMDTTTTALDKLQHELGAEIVHPVKIYIYANTSDMYSAMQSNEVEWVGGQANLGLGVIIGTIAPGDTAEIGRLIPHELSHLVLAQATENPYGGVPLWLHEGLSVYNQNTVEYTFHILVNDAAETRALIPLEALASSFPTDPSQAALSYAESYSVVTYLIDTYGPEGMHKLVSAFDTGMTVEEALQEAFGLSVEQLDRQWQETLPPSSGQPEPTPTLETVAPSDRFSGEPVLPDDVNDVNNMVDTPVPPDTSTNPNPVIPAPVPTSGPQAVGVIPGVALPLWAELGIASACCIVVIAVTGGALLVILRMVGADKQG